jgi:thiol:disulfide interchange protein DsbD
MIRKTNPVLIYCLLAALAFMACGKAENTTSKDATANSNAAASPAPTQSAESEIVSSASVVRVEASATEAAAGGSGEASVKLSIKDGYHVNANPPSMSYLIPTELSIAPIEGITASKPVYPSSITKKFAFSETPLAVYETEAVVKLPLKIAATASKGARSLNAKLRVQACDDKACYKPDTLQTSIPLTIK